MSSSRQLAAIMFTDIVGYTAMMQQNEKAALEKINRFRQVLEGSVAEHYGKIIQFYGDGCLLLFNSAVEAAHHAKFLQEEFRKEPTVPVRIGIHLGDVLLKEGNVFGDGVNVASRIQSLGQPNSVLFSAEVQDKIKNNPDLQTVSLGIFEFKNVSNPIEIFALTNEGLIVPQRKTLEGKLKKKNVRKRNVIAALSFILLVAAGSLVYKNFIAENKKAYAPQKSIAVLPFVDMSAGKDQEYFSDGLSEELINLLAKIPELKVIGRTSSFSFKSKNDDLRSIAQKLGVAHILEGSVRKDGNMIRVTSQLIRADDGSHLWSEKYDRDLEGIFKLQDEIAGAVVKQLKLKLLIAPSGAVSSADVKVHNLILQGNYFAEKRDKENLARALDFYLQALSIDSSNARSWAAIAECYSLQSDWGWIDRNQGFKLAQTAAAKSIELDDNLAKGHLESGRIKKHDYDWKGAEDEYEKALNLEPGNADILRNMGILYWSTGRFDEAIRITKQSVNLDPIKAITHLNLGQILKHANYFEDAIESYKKVLELNPQFPRTHLFLGEAYLMLGKPEMALTEIQQETDKVSKDFGMALVYHALSRRKEADEMLKEFFEKYQNDWSYLLAKLHAFRKEKDKAFEWLDNAYIRKDSWLTYLKGDPLLKNLESDLRYTAFLKKMNLPVD
ncbi:MAG TPA: tetratricopeptide repeat protein [Chitinophagaceae bacterium]|nr:tetratricopeptide repeat protein [Chitinophagaceae bacterium]